jgi:glyoxylase-like metal-dependent hydrolase (beta-lactamase superfamily II)
MNSGRQIGRRTWLRRSAAGLVALWAGLDFGRGRAEWGVLLGEAGPRAATAQEEPLPPVVTAPILLDLGAVSVNAFVLLRGPEVAIVDTLMPGNVDRFDAVLGAAGVGWDAVRHVILTHYHTDHAGSAAAVSGRATQATIWAGAADVAEIPLERPIRAAADGDEIFGLRVVATPGHTAGHIAVLDPLGSALYTGDAAFNIDGTLVGVIPQYTADVAQAQESVRKLGTLSYERAYFAHGPAIPSGASAAIAALAASGDDEGTRATLAAALRGCCV